jgi:protein-tyrosine-phosphatase
MAELLFKDILISKRINKEEWHVESAGIYAIPSYPATHNAILAMKEFGLDLNSHRSQPVTEELIQSFNLILTMESTHQHTLQQLSPSSTQNVYMLSEMIDIRADVQDPIGSPLQEYITTANLIKKYLLQGWNRILQLSDHH